MTAAIYGPGPRRRPTPVTTRANATTRLTPPRTTAARGNARLSQDAALPTEPISKVMARVAGPLIETPSARASQTFDPNQALKQADRRNGALALCGILALTVLTVLSVTLAGALLIHSVYNYFV